MISSSILHLSSRGAAFASVCRFVFIHFNPFDPNYLKFGSAARICALIARAASPFSIVCTVDQYRWKCFTLHSFVSHSFLSAKRHDRRIRKVFRSICRSPFWTSFCIFSSAIAIKHKRRSNKVMVGKNNDGKMKRNGLCNRVQLEVEQRRRRRIWQKDERKERKR